MYVQLLEKEFSVDNNEQGIQQLIDTINETLVEKNVYFSHMVVDGEEVFDDPAEYIFNNIEKVQQIYIKVKTIKQFVNNVMVSLNTYTERAIPEIQRLVDQFYQNPSSESWATLEQLLEGIEWIYQTIKNIDRANKTQYKWGEYLKVAATFEVELPNLMDAIENKDTILIADIIQYEILPQFQKVYDTTEEAFNQNDRL